MKKRNILCLFILGIVLIMTSCTTPTVEKKLETIQVSNKSQLIFKTTEFNLTNIYITCIYDNGETKDISVTEEMITNEIPNSLGKHILNISYEDKSCDIEIELIHMIELEFSSDSVRVFKQGSFDHTLLDMFAVYTNGSKEKINVTLDMINGLDELDKIGEHNILITYQGITVNYNLEIIENDDVENFIFEVLPYNDGYIVTDYIGDRTSLVIPSEYNGLPVKEIASKAFFKESRVKRIVIPNTVTTIGEAAFYQSTSIQSIIIPSSVTTIEAYGVRGIKIIYLENETIPSGYASSWYDDQNTYINFNVNPEDVKFNGEYEYYIKDGQMILSNYFGSDSIVYIPSIINNNLPKVIGGSCFKDNLNIEELYIPESVTKLEKYSIAGLENLTNLVLSSNIEEIGDYAIRGCSSLENIKLPTNLVKIGHSAFNHCSNLKEIILPESVEYIGDYAFSWCVSVTKIYIPSSVQIIKAGACYSCSKATIYTPYISEPSTWETGWNQSNRPVVWGNEE